MSKEDEEFPSSKMKRGKTFAKTGLRLGTNYAKRYLKKSVGKKETDEESRSFHMQNARQVFNEFIKLRGTALKIAQSLSMDQGILPEEFTEVMSEAQYSVPPINRALIRTIVKRELGDYPENIFSEFDTEAVAAASIGQVHRARLPGGADVAVKIQYPNVRNTIHSDLVMAKTLVKRLAKRGANLDEYFDEVESTLVEETDYRQEGEYLQYFHRKFDGDRLVIPRLHESFSTGKVLTMDFVEGEHLNEFLKKDPPQKRRNHFGQLLWDFFHEQVAQRDFIHADTHPGNFLFREDGRLGVIDFGCVKNFPMRFTQNYLMLLPTHLEKDEGEIRKLYEDLGIVKANPDNPKKEEEFFQFCKNYGSTFAQPYQQDTFDFGSPDFKKAINTFSRQLPLMNEPRGDKHFIFSTRVHLGLYNILMKLKAQVDTTQSKQTAYSVLDTLEGG